MNLEEIVAAWGSISPSSLIQSFLPSTSSLIMWAILLLILWAIFGLIFRQSYNRYNKNNQKIKLLKTSNELLQQQVTLQQEILNKLNANASVWLQAQKTSESPLVRPTQTSSPQLVAWAQANSSFNTPEE